MSFAGVQSRLVFQEYSNQADSDAIVAALQSLYVNAPLNGATMLEKLNTQNRTLIFKYEAGKLEVKSDGKVYFDPAAVSTKLFISHDGTGVAAGIVDVLAHELQHAINGLFDDPLEPAHRAGPTVIAANLIHAELGIEDRLSYHGTGGPSQVIAGKEYTNGETIDTAIVVTDLISTNPHYNVDQNNHTTNSRDLLIGSGVGNSLSGGAGNDYLYGLAGSDTLDGGEGADKIYGGDNNDTLIADDGDSIDGGAGDDVIIVDVNTFELEGGQIANPVTVTDSDGKFSLLLDLTFSGNPSTGYVIRGGTNEIYLDIGTLVKIVGLSDYQTDYTVIQTGWPSPRQVRIDYVGTPTGEGWGGDTGGGGGSSGNSISGTSGHTDSLAIPGNAAAAFTVSNFNYSEGDRLDISGFDAALTNLAALSITNSGGNAQFTLPATGGNSAVTVTVNGLSAAAMNASYFLSNTLAYGAGSTLTGSDNANLPDTIDGTFGNDTIHANSGNDSASGGTSGGTGNDVAYGWYGNDTLKGGYGADSLYGDQDNDQLYGESGNDHLFGYTGLDTVYGGDGDDYIDGEADADQLRGDKGNDTIYGGAGNDLLIGGAGADSLYGDAPGFSGADSFRYFTRSDSTSAASDWIKLFKPTVGDRIDLTGLGFSDLRQGYGTGNILGWEFHTNSTKNIKLFSDSFTLDVGYESNISGVLLADFVGVGPGFTVTHQGDDSANTLTGGAGNDALQGGLSKDVIDGGTGNGNSNDTLDGGAGDDVLKGRDGADVYFYDELTDSPNDGRDLIQYWDGDDRIDVRFLGYTGFDTVAGATAHDSILTYAKNVPGDYTLVHNSNGFEIKIEGVHTLTASNFIFSTGPGFEDESYTGTNGNDTHTGAQGNDSLSGGAGLDSLAGGVGADTLVGGAGNDTLIGGLGGDQLDGGADLDRLEGGDGNDLLIGGAADDYMIGGTGIDTFLFYDANPAHSTTAHWDYIVDFVHGVDKIRIKDLDYTHLVADATPTGDELGYYSSGGDTWLKGSLNGGFLLQLNGNIPLSSIDVEFIN